MNSTPTAWKEHKKQPFLKAFARSGKVAPATRAVRISRDVVYDWLKNDPRFRREFESAKRVNHDSSMQASLRALDHFLEISKPLMPSECFNRVVAAVNLSITQKKFNVGSTTVRTNSRHKARLPSFDVLPEQANSGEDGRRAVSLGKNGPIT